MTGAAEARLAALAEQCRRRHGEDFLGDRDRFAPFLLGEAPELRPQIRAMAAALAGDGIRRLGGATAQTLQRLAGEIAAAEGIAPEAAEQGVRAAAAAAGIEVAAAPPEAAWAAAPDDGWVGDSLVAPRSPQPAEAAAQPQPAPAPAGPPSGIGDLQGLLTNKWVLGGLAAVAVLYFVQQQPQQPQQQQPQQPQQQPQQQGPQQQPQQQGTPGQQGLGVPQLVDPQEGQLPTLPVQVAQGNPLIGFALPSQGGLLEGAVMVAAQGWDGGAIVSFSDRSTTDPQTVSNLMPAVLQPIQGGAARVIRPVWVYDSLGIKDICVVFQQQGVQDVSLRGSMLCVYSANCAQAIGCGTVP